MSGDLAEEFAHECAIRDVYALRLPEFRPQEHLIRTEPTVNGSNLRADMKTVDVEDTLRIWEFKIHADYRSVGQVLTYLAMERLGSPERKVRAVLAAFDLSAEIVQANEILNLGIEMITLPPILKRAGEVPAAAVEIDQVPFIPNPLNPLES
ncbi:hypothetical protein [Streptomyces phaeochromogenes]|uniref:hypothetical protein n=1 Tax=Streptomyces phaeochromogenes TaxID=1923 RepID=UPI0037158E50